MPGKNSLGLDDVGYFSQGLLAELLADLRQGLTLAVTQPEAPLDLIPEDAVFRRQVLVTQEEFLVD
jgi:hypothetical protein